jgi:leucyl-tRNA synthetase
MELSALVKEYNLPLTRAESNLVSQLPTGTSEISSDQYDQRIKSLAAARDLLNQLPDRQTLERRSRMEKAAMLKERLKILRQMIAFLTPSAAKSLKSEMKQIASQIASLGAGSAGAGGSAIVAMNVPAAEIPDSAQEAEKSKEAAPLSDTNQGENGNRQDQQAPSVAVLPGQEAKSGTPNTEDRQLKEMVTELKALYKAVLEALKRKQQAGQGSGQLPCSASNLRVYMTVPDGVRSVAFNA